MKVTLKIGERFNSADMCRKNGWKVGTQLVGDEGYGPTVIELTAIGEKSILAKKLSHNGEPNEHPNESHWTLELRDWKKVERSGGASKEGVEDEL